MVLDLRPSRRDRSQVAEIRRLTDTRVRARMREENRIVGTPDPVRDPGRVEHEHITRPFTIEGTARHSELSELDLFATLGPDRGRVVDRVVRGSQFDADVKDGRAASEPLLQLLTQVVRSVHTRFCFRQAFVAVLGYEVVAPEARPVFTFEAERVQAVVRDACIARGGADASSPRSRAAGPRDARPGTRQRARRRVHPSRGRGGACR